MAVNVESSKDSGLSCWPGVRHRIDVRTHVWSQRDRLRQVSRVQLVRCKVFPVDAHHNRVRHVLHELHRMDLADRQVNQKLPVFQVLHLLLVLLCFQDPYGEIECILFSVI